MARCQICGKKSVVGRTSRHHRGVASKKFIHRAPKKRKVFKANIQKTTIRVGGLKMSLRLCARCLKKMRQKIDRKPTKIEKKKPVSSPPAEPRQ